MFEKIIFLYLKTKKEELGYPKEQHSLIVMDTFRVEDEIKALCLKTDYELFIVYTAKLTNKFNPPDISINQKANKFISYNFNTWYADRVSDQLKRKP